MLYSIVLAFAISSVNQPQVHTCPLPADPPPPHPHRVTEPRLCSLPNGSLVSIAKTHWSSAAAAHAWQECTTWMTHTVCAVTRGLFELREGSLSLSCAVTLQQTPSWLVNMFMHFTHFLSQNYKCFVFAST